MKAKRASAPPTEMKGSGAMEPDQEVSVKPTPVLVVLGIVALLAGLVVGLLMSQATFLR